MLTTGATAVPVRIPVDLAAVVQGWQFLPDQPVARLAESAYERRIEHRPRPSPC